MRFSRLRILTLFAFILSFFPANGQQTPFNRGVNLTGWFQAGSAEQIQFTKYTKKDFEQVQDLNCDVIRLPINLHFMTDGAPDYNLDPLFLEFLDQVTDWAEELNMHLIFDNHTFDPSSNTDPAVGAILLKVWTQMAAHFKDRSELVYYEILNEPHGISDAVWNSIQQEVVSAIREIDQKHTIIVGGAGWNSYNNLDDMPVYDDDNLIYTFHFYDPFLFTHQGASWVQPSMVPLSGIPFPYNASEMPGLPPSLVGTWVGSNYNSYSTDGTVAKVRSLLDIAIAFRDARQVPVFCGEFGVLMNNSDNEDRVFWYGQVREYLEANQISWTMWDYHGGFGVFEKGSNGLYDHDLNVPLLQALDLVVPPQTGYIQRPDSTGFLIYGDYIGNKVFESGYTTGELSFYAKDLPNYGKYCIRWADAGQYQNIGFDFLPDKDLTLLKDQDYALDFFVRGDAPGKSFDVRFIDSDTEDPEDHPWRMRYTVDENDAAWDQYWHHLHIPLTAFTEHGAWEDGSWYNPIGDFDWTAIDRFEIVSEHGSLSGVQFWFDQIQVTELDTALINEGGIFTHVEQKGRENRLLFYPNPARNQLTIESAHSALVEWQITDLAGQELKQGDFNQKTTIQLGHLEDGIYLVNWKQGKIRGTHKMLVL